MDYNLQEIFTISAPESVAITVEDLLPYTKYRLRMLAENIAGQSPASDPTRWFDTLQAPPSTPPREVTVRAVNETAQRVRWTVSIHTHTPSLVGSVSKYNELNDQVSLL